MTDYVKIKLEDVSYYFVLQVAGEAFKALAENNIMMLIQLANFVVEGDTNKMLKCRYTLEDIFDEYCGMNLQINDLRS